MPLQPTLEWQQHQAKTQQAQSVSPYIAQVQLVWANQWADLRRGDGLFYNNNKLTHIIET